MTKEVESLLDTLKQDFVEPKILEGKLVACPVIAGRVLQISNSSFYGLSREISSLREATIILGQHTLKSLIYSLAAMDEFKGSKEKDNKALDYTLIWQHSLFSACLARTIAEYKKLNSSDIFTSALFQHFGILIIENIESEKITEAMNLSKVKNASIKKAIFHITKLNYINLSAEALNFWHFPVSVCELIHSLKKEKIDPNRSTETKILQLSNFITSAFIKSPLSIGNNPIDKDILDLVESEADFLRLLEQTDILYAQMASNFIG